MLAIQGKPSNHRLISIWHQYWLYIYVLKAYITSVYNAKRKVFLAIIFISWLVMKKSSTVYIFKCDSKVPIDL